MIAAEWTKLRTSPALWGLLVGLVVATVGLSLALDSSGVALGQVAAAMVGVLTIGGEYATGMIHASLAAMPRRVAFLAAKLTVLSGATIAASALTLLGGHEGWRTVAHLTLMGLFGFGVALGVRDPVAAMGVVLGLLYFSPILVLAIGDPEWKQRILDWAPGSGGLRVLAVWAVAALAVNGYRFLRRDA